MPKFTNLFKNCLTSLLSFFTLVFVLLLSPDGISQNSDASGQFKMNLQNAQHDLEAIGIYHNTSHLRLQALEESYANIAGTPYLHKDWVAGNIHLVSGYVHKEVKIKLDIYNDMILYQGKAGLIALHKDYINKFVLHLKGSRQVFEKIDLDAKNNTFYEIIYNGPTRLLKYYSKELIKANTEEIDRKYDEFVNRDIYYLELGNRKYAKIKLNKSSVLKNLPNNGKDLKDYLKNTSLDLRTEADLVELLDFYDSN